MKKGHIRLLEKAVNIIEEKTEVRIMVPLNKH